MQAVVPAAGEGTRLRPRTDDRPKGLVEIAGKPLLTHCFETLVALDVERILVVVGYRGGQIRERYGHTFDGVSIAYVEQSRQRGLAHAIGLVEPHVDGPFVELHGDSILRANPGDVVARRRETDADAVLLVEEVSREAARRLGVCVTDDAGRLERIVEKPDDPPSRLVQTSFFAFSPRIFEACRAIEPSDRGEFELPAAITHLLETGGRVETVRLDGWRVNVNDPQDVHAAERRLSE